MNEHANPVLPETKQRGALLGAGAVVIWNDIKPEGRDAFYTWHDKEHMPERLALPGFLRGRRYRKAGHSPEWLTLYEAQDLEALRSPQYLARLNAPTPQTKATLVYFANTSRAVCRVGHSVGASSGGFVLALRLDATSSQRRRGPGDVDADDTGFPPARERQQVVAAALREALAVNGIVACHYFVTDAAASFVKTAESKDRRIDVPASIVLIEATHEAAAECAHGLLGAARWSPLGLSARADAAIYALEICRLHQPESEGARQRGEG